MIHKKEERRKRARDEDKLEVLLKVTERLNIRNVWDKRQVCPENFKRT